MQSKLIKENFLKVSALATSIWTAAGWLYIVNGPIIHHDREDAIGCISLNLLTAITFVVGTFALARAYYLAFPNVTEPPCLTNSNCYNKLQLTAGTSTSLFFAGMGAYGLAKTVGNVLGDAPSTAYIVPIIGVSSGIIFAIAQLAVLIKIKVISDKWVLPVGILNGACNGMVMYYSSRLNNSVMISLIIGLVTLISGVSFLHAHLSIAKSFGGEHSDNTQTNTPPLKYQKSRAALGLASILMFTALIIINSTSTTTTTTTTININSSANITNTKNSSVTTENNALPCEKFDPNIFKALPWWLNSVILLIGFFPLNVSVFLHKKTEVETTEDAGIDEIEIPKSTL